MAPLPSATAPPSPGRMPPITTASCPPCAAPRRTRRRSRLRTFRCALPARRRLRRPRRRRSRSSRAVVSCGARRRAVSATTSGTQRVLGRDTGQVIALPPSGSRSGATTPATSSFASRPKRTPTTCSTAATPPSTRCCTCSPTTATTRASPAGMTRATAACRPSSA